MSKGISIARATLVGIIAAIVVAAAGAFAGAALIKQGLSGKTITIIIPRGAQAKINQGQKGLIPERIVGYQGDRLVIVNRDKAAQHVGPFYVEGSQRLNYSLSRAGVFAGECSLTPNGRFTLVVKKERSASAS